MQGRQEEDEIKLVRERLQKFCSFIKYFQIPASSIFQKCTAMSIHELALKFEQFYGYRLSLDEVTGLMKIAKGQSLLLNKQVFHILGLWGEKQPCLATFEIGKNKRKKGREKYKSEQSHESGQFLSSLDNSVTKSRKNLNISYQGKVRRSNIQKKLKNKIIQNTLDKKWDYLIKVGQMNNWLLNAEDKDICTSKTPQYSEQQFRVKNKEEDIQILDENDDIIPLTVFDLKYEGQKKKQAEQSKRKNNMKGTVMMVLEDKQKFNKNKLQEKLVQRDQELNYVLLEIIKMKSTLEYQSTLLHECHVNI